MSGELAKPEQTGLIGILHGAGGAQPLPKPFEQEIFLFDSMVAGTTHVEGILELEPQLQTGERLSFFREPDNPHDAQAIRVQTEAGQKIGYVPQRDNVIFARLMDAGKILFGRIAEKELRGRWLRISMQIYLHE